MSTAALSAAAAALWPELRRLLRRLGRWILAKLIEAGATWLRRYMAERIAVFEHRMKAGADLAKWGRTEGDKRRGRMKRRRNERRIARWRWAAAWIAANAKRLRPTVLRGFEALAQRIPERPRWEREA